jgi:hypothetical protein
MPNPTPSHHVAPQSGHHSEFDIPSSDPIEELEDVTLFPRLSDWLQTLDEGPWGADGHNFGQFAPDFKHEKYFRISDIGDVHITTLLAICPGMANGTATKLLAHAKKDTEKIHKKEMKRLCQVRYL